MQTYQNAKSKLFQSETKANKSLKQKQNNLTCRRAGAGWLSKRGREWRCVSATASNVGSQRGDDHPTHTAGYVLFYILTVEQVSFFFFLYFSPTDLKGIFVLSLKTLDEERFLFWLLIDIFLSHRKVFCFHCWLKQNSVTLSCTLSRLLTFSCLYLPFKTLRNKWQQIPRGKFLEEKHLWSIFSTFLSLSLFPPLFVCCEPSCVLSASVEYVFVFLDHS